MWRKLETTLLEEEEEEEGHFLPSQAASVNQTETGARKEEEKVRIKCHPLTQVDLEEVLGEFSTLQRKLNFHQLHSIATGTVLVQQLVLVVESYAFAVVVVAL